MKVCTWNVNSIRARREHVLKFLVEESPDVAMLQETKCSDNDFYRDSDVYSNLGYNCYHKGQSGGRNGVVIFSKNKLKVLDSDFEFNNHEEARYLECVDAEGNYFINVYVPNGQDLDSEKFAYKKKFLISLSEFLKSNKEKSIIICGDWNIALNALDVYDPVSLSDNVCFCSEARSLLRSFFNIGYVDAFSYIYPNKQQFTWWGYRGGGWQNNFGMRIDYIILSPTMSRNLKDTKVYYNYRGLEKPSDHVPVISFLEFIK